MLWTLGLVAIVADLCFSQWGGEFDLAGGVIGNDQQNITKVNIAVIQVHFLNGTKSQEEAKVSFYDAPKGYQTESPIINPQLNVEDEQPSEIEGRSLLEQESSVSTSSPEPIEVLWEDPTPRTHAKSYPKILGGK